VERLPESNAEPEDEHDQGDTDPPACELLSPPAPATLVAVYRA
jgi:hypothetical protein